MQTSTACATHRLTLSSRKQPCAAMGSRLTMWSMVFVAHRLTFRQAPFAQPAVIFKFKPAAKPILKKTLKISQLAVAVMAQKSKLQM